MASPSRLRRFWFVAHVGVMVSLLFGTVHPVQPAISTRGTSGRASFGSRFEAWSEAATLGHDDADFSVEEGRVAALVGAALDDSAAGAPLAAPVVPPVPAAPDGSADRLTTSDRAPARSRSVSPSLGRAPPPV